MSERVSSEDVTAFINLATLHLYPSRDLEKETLPVEVKIAFDLLDARRERDEARAALLDVYEGVKLCYATSTIDAIAAARAAGGGGNE